MHLSLPVHIGAEKSGRNAQGDTWWETWQEILRQDEWRLVNAAMYNCYASLWDTLLSRLKMFYLRWISERSTLAGGRISANSRSLGHTASLYAWT